MGGRLPLLVIWRVAPSSNLRSLSSAVATLYSQLSARSTAVGQLGGVILEQGLPFRPDWEHVVTPVVHYALTRIRCPTLICVAEGDDLSADIPALYAALTCEKRYVAFTAAEGAAAHCESGARTLFHQRAFDWLATVMAAPPPAKARA